MDGNPSVGEDTNAIFLDEFRVMVFIPNNHPDAFGFTLFNTLVPRGHPANSLQFCLPQEYHDRLIVVRVDSDRCLGTLDRDKPLTTDPTQAVLAVKFVNFDRPPVFIIVRIHTLIENLSSMSPGASVPWDAWGMLEDDLNEHA